MPTNLYGPNDNYHPVHSHVLPALIRRFHEAKLANQPEVVCWGDGSPLREFLYVDDLANLCVFLLNNYSTTKPNGTPRKLLNVDKARKLGWTYSTELDEGLKLAYEDFLNNPTRAER